MLLYFKLKKKNTTKTRNKNLYQTIYKTYKHFKLSKYTAIQLKYQETGYTDCYIDKILFAVLLTFNWCTCFFS